MQQNPTCIACRDSPKNLFRPSRHTKHAANQRTTNPTIDSGLAESHSEFQSTLTPAITITTRHRRNSVFGTVYQQNADEANAAPQDGKGVTTVKNNNKLYLGVILAAITLGPIQSTANRSTKISIAVGWGLRQAFSLSSFRVFVSCFPSRIRELAGSMQPETQWHTAYKERD